MLTTTLAVCSFLPFIFDDIIIRREQLGYSEVAYQQHVAELVDIPEPLRRKMLLTSYVLYALPKGSNYENAKLQITLTCDNKETIRGYQYPTERAGG